MGERREPAYGLAAIGAHCFCYGLSTVGVLLLYRNTFHGPGDADAAFNDLATVVLVSGIGFLLAAVVTPIGVERIAPRTWIISLLAAASVTQVFPGVLFTKPAVLVAAFVLGLASQGIKICVHTLVQLGVHDAFRGWIFSLYDVLFNVAVVAAAAVAALVVPESGKSYAVVAAIALGYALTAIAYARAARGVATGLPR